MWLQMAKALSDASDVDWKLMYLGASWRETDTQATKHPWFRAEFSFDLIIDAIN